MQNPWDVRARQPKGDLEPDTIFLAVGRALYVWEALESQSAELFDALVAAQPSNRAAFAAFTAVKASSARTELLEAAMRRAAPLSDPARNDLEQLINAIGKLGARRNEIAHGLVVNMGEFGFYLGPNNVMPNKWAKDGSAKFQYVASDIDAYRSSFEALRVLAKTLTLSLVQRDFAKRSDLINPRDRSRHREIGMER